jgi:hypothetical protein
LQDAAAPCGDSGFGIVCGHGLRAGPSITCDDWPSVEMAASRVHDALVRVPSPGTIAVCIRVTGILARK